MPNRIRNYCPWIKEERSRLERCCLPLTAWNSEPNSTQSDLLFPKPNPVFQSCNWIKCQSLLTLETHQYNSSSKFFEFNSLVQSSQTLSIFLFLEEFLASSKQALVQPLFNKPPLSTDPLIHLYPLMISRTFVQFQTTTSFPECSKQPPTFNLTCPNSLFFSNLLTGSFILLKLLFLKFTMTSSMR